VRAKSKIESSSACVSGERSFTDGLSSNTSDKGSETMDITNTENATKLTILTHKMAFSRLVIGGLEVESHFVFMVFS